MPGNRQRRLGLTSKFGDDELVIRAKRDKPPAIRKAHGKLWLLFTHLKSLGHNDAEIDWRNCSLWINDCEVVKWDIDTDSAIWMEDGHVSTQSPDRCCCGQFGSDSRSELMTNKSSNSSPLNDLLSCSSICGFWLQISRPFLDRACSVDLQL